MAASLARAVMSLPEKPVEKGEVGQWGVVKGWRGGG